MSKSGGRTNRNLLNLTLPSSSSSSSVTHSPDEIKISSLSTTDSKETNSTQLDSLKTVPVATIMRTRNAPSQLPSGALNNNRTPASSSSHHVRVVTPNHTNSSASPTIRYNSGNKYSNRISTGPVDVDEVLRRLEAQDLDEQQRISLSAFVAQKEKIGELRPEDFEKIRELGKGNGGVVSQVRHATTGLIMAKKNIHLEIKPAVRSQIIRELQVLHDCNSPYIVGYYGAFFADGDISLCMEYMDGSSLDIVLQHAGRIPEPIVAKILYATLKGLIYLGQTLNIIHRDVKPSNILVKHNGEVKLCDFGVSGQLTDSLANSFVGTRSYMAPERLTGEQYNILSDVWSVGLSLVELTTGRYPIPALDESDKSYLTAFSLDRGVNLRQHLEVAKNGRPLPIVRNENAEPMAIFELLGHIVDQPAPRLPRSCFSDDFIDLVDSCLHSSPNDRPSLGSLLKHPFVTTVAGACPSGVGVCRQSTILELREEDAPDTSSDPINIGNYLTAVLPPVSPDEAS